MPVEAKVVIGIPQKRVTLSQEDFLEKVNLPVYDRLLGSNTFYDCGHIGEDGVVQRILTLPLETEGLLFNAPVIGDQVLAVTIPSSNTPSLDRLAAYQDDGRIDHYGRILPDGTGESTLIGLPEDIRSLFGSEEITSE